MHTHTRGRPRHPTPRYTVLVARKLPVARCSVVLCAQSRCTIYDYMIHYAYHTPNSTHTLRKNPHTADGPGARSKNIPRCRLRYGAVACRLTALVTCDCTFCFGAKKKRSEAKSQSLPQSIHLPDHVVSLAYKQHQHRTHNTRTNTAHTTNTRTYFACICRR